MPLSAKALQCLPLFCSPARNKKTSEAIRCRGRIKPPKGSFCKGVDRHGRVVYLRLKSAERGDLADTSHEASLCRIVHELRNISQDPGLLEHGSLFSPGQEFLRLGSRHERSQKLRLVGGKYRHPFYPDMLGCDNGISGPEVTCPVHLSVFYQGTHDDRPFVSVVEFGMASGHGYPLGKAFLMYLSHDARRPFLSP